MAYGSLPTRPGERGYIGPETAYFGGGLKPFTRTIVYPNGNPNYRGPKTSRLNLNALMSRVTKGVEEARAANLMRYDQIMSIYDNLESRLSPGGAFERAGMAKIGAAKKQDVGQELSRLIGSGLASTTEYGAAGRKWEASVGAQARNELQSIMEDKLTAIKLGKAGAIERRTDTGPDISTLVNLLANV
jgi:hypothetical protein